VNDIEPTPVMKGQERLTGATKPSWVSSWKPWMTMGRVYVVPARPVSFLFEETLRMPSRQDFDFMASCNKPLCERSRVVLHSTDTMPCNGYDANPHRRAC
jgi:hypothetical protein